jgi:hypothetical protein
MAGVDEFRDDGGPDESGRAGDKYAHEQISRWSSVS